MAANSLPLDFGYLADTKFIFDQDKVHTFPLLKRTIICFYPSETIVMFGSVSCRVLKGKKKKREERGEANLFIIIIILIYFFYY